MHSKKLLVAYVWNLTGTLVPRCLGIISTLFLVRLLSPVDFGLVALATMIIGFFAVISEMGAYRYLILKDHPSDEMYNACWTFNILIKSLSISILYLLAPYIAIYLSNPEATHVIQVMSLIQIIGLFKNIGMVKFEKEVNYSPNNKLLIYAKLVSFVFTLSAAFYYKNYYALVIGSTANMLAQLILSYLLCEYRPKFTLRLPKDLMSFSWYMILRNTLGYSRSQIDTLLVGRFYGNTTLGYFNVTRQFSNIPLTEIIEPAMSPLFSALSSTIESKKNASHAIYKLLFLSWLFLAPWVSYFYILGDEFTSVVLGEKWLPVSPLLGPVALLMLAFASQSIIFMLYDIMGKTKLSIFNDVFGIILIITAFTYFSPTGIVDFTIIRQYVAILSIVIIFLFAAIFLKMNMKKLLVCSGIPTLLALTTYQLTLYIKVNLFTIESDIVGLIVFSTLGLIQYIVAVFIVSLIIKQIKNSDFLISLFSIFSFDAIKKMKEKSQNLSKG